MTQAKASRPKLATLKPTTAMANLSAATPMPAGETPGSWRSGLSSTARGYGYRWQQERARFLQAHPLCVMCEQEGIIREAHVVDHSVPHRGDQAIFWDSSRWRALCKSHHDSEAQVKDHSYSVG